MPEDAAVDTLDAVVVGAGFAGLVAARELHRSGFDVAVVEARDRIGGRTWTDTRLGRRLEMGGTWVHWSQPHTWAELTRYGVEVVRSPRAEEAFWLDGGEVRRGAIGAFDELLEPAQSEIVRDSRDVFPRPDEPCSPPVPDAVDARSLADRIGELDLSPAERSVNESVWVGHVNGPLEGTALTAALRWSAATGGGWRTMHEASSTFKLADGMRAFSDAIAAELPGRIELGADIRRIRSLGRGARAGVELESATGRVYRARRAIVTVPFAALDRIEFDPGLPHAVRALGASALANNGLKVWIRVRGRVTPFFAYSTPRHAVSVLKSEFIGDDESVLVGFGPDHAAFDFTSTSDAQAAVDVWRDDLTVLDVAAHDWMQDPLSATTWQLLRPGHLRHLPGTQAPFGPIRFASSDNANLWPGFIDGAIESGLRAARAVAAELG